MFVLSALVSISKCNSLWVRPPELKEPKCEEDRILTLFLGPISNKTKQNPRPKQAHRDRAREAKNTKRPHGNLAVPGILLYVRCNFCERASHAAMTTSVPKMAVGVY